MFGYVEFVALVLVLCDSPWLECAVECKMDTVDYSLGNTFMDCARSIMVDASVVSNSTRDCCRHEYLESLQRETGSN